MFLNGHPHYAEGKEVAPGETLRGFIYSETNEAWCMETTTVDRCLYIPKDRFEKTALPRANPVLNAERKDDTEKILPYVMRAFNESKKLKLVETFMHRGLLIQLFSGKDWMKIPSWVWIVYANDPMPVGGGTFKREDSLHASYAMAGVAGMLPEVQGHGVYTEAIKHLLKHIGRLKGLISSANMSAGSVKAWERAGAVEVSLPGVDTTHYLLRKGKPL